MALSRFVVTAAVVVPAGTVSAVSQPGSTVSWAGAAGAWADGMNPGALPDAYDAQSAVTFVPGQVIVASSLSTDGAPYALYLAIGAGNLRPYVQSQDERGGAALSN